MTSNTLADRVEAAEGIADADHCDGYFDGRDRDAPWPSGNRSAEYKHSFEVGRAEIIGKPIPAATSRKRSDALAALRARATTGRDG